MSAAGDSLSAYPMPICPSSTDTSYHCDWNATPARPPFLPRRARQRHWRVGRGSRPLGRSAPAPRGRPRRRVLGIRILRSPPIFLGTCCSGPALGPTMRRDRRSQSVSDLGIAWPAASSVIVSCAGRQAVLDDMTKADAAAPRQTPLFNGSRCASERLTATPLGQSRCGRRGRS